MLRLLRRYPIWFMPALASASGAEAADDTSVLCSWEFLVVMSLYDEACRLEQNLEMKRALQSHFRSSTPYSSGTPTCRIRPHSSQRRRTTCVKACWRTLRHLAKVDLTHAAMMKSSVSRRTIGISLSAIHLPGCVHG